MSNYPPEIWFQFYVLLAFGLAFGLLEGTGRAQLAYSKFRKGGRLNARAAMFFIYLIPSLVYLAGWWNSGKLLGLPYERPISPFHMAALLAFTFHFWKRCLEVLFLHRYSRPMGIVTPLLVTCGYALIASSAERTIDNIPAHDGWAQAVQWRTLLGLVIFFYGEFLNFKHHRILARLRAPGETAYRVPNEGLFKRVACPHYLYEIVAWIGIAAISGHIIVFGLVAVMAAYLTGRAYRTRAWYRENLPDYPPERKALIPFVF